MAYILPDGCYDDDEHHSLHSRFPFPLGSLPMRPWSHIYKHKHAMSIVKDNTRYQMRKISKLTSALGVGTWAIKFQEMQCWSVELWTARSGLIGFSYWQIKTTKDQLSQNSSHKKANLIFFLPIRFELVVKPPTRHTTFEFQFYP
jgi:hypothetical protein